MIRGRHDHANYLNHEINHKKASFLSSRELKSSFFQSRALKREVKFIHDLDKFPTLNNKNNKQCRFLALKQQHSMEITNTIVLGLKFNLFGKKSRFVSFDLGNITF